MGNVGAMALTLFPTENVTENGTGPSARLTLCQNGTDPGGMVKRRLDVM